MTMSEDDWDSVIATNLKGTFNCSKAAGHTCSAQALRSHYQHLFGGRANG
jgi:NAD(P)-dependent dehydrogenase (short-subunit alcohol dehydrogenase family)